MRRQLFLAAMTVAALTAAACEPNEGDNFIICDCRCTPTPSFGDEFFCLAPSCRIEGRTCAAGDTDDACVDQCASKSTDSTSCVFVREIDFFVEEPDAFPDIEQDIGLGGAADD